MQLRGGVGVKAAHLAEKTGDMVTAQILTRDDEALILTSQKGQIIRTTLRSIPRLTRDTQGVIIMRLSAGDKVAAATVVQKKKEDADEPEGLTPEMIKAAEQAEKSLDENPKKSAASEKSKVTKVAKKPVAKLQKKE